MTPLGRPRTTLALKCLKAWKAIQANPPNDIPAPQHASGSKCLLRSSIVGVTPSASMLSGVFEPTLHSFYTVFDFTCARTRRGVARLTLRYSLRESLAGDLALLQRATVRRPVDFPVLHQIESLRERVKAGILTERPHRRKPDDEPARAYRTGPSGLVECAIARCVCPVDGRRLACTATAAKTSAAVPYRRTEPSTQDGGAPRELRVSSRDSPQLRRST